ncbi:MAG: sulfite exporter TauE/SafE family protein [Bacteroidota bacterium]
MEFVLALFGGLALGCIHAFDIDHIIAVSVFASKYQDPWKAAKLGISWGLGHTATLLVLGLTSVAFRFVISPFMQSVAETIVGVLLVGIGAWVLFSGAGKKHIHVHKHEHDGLEHVHVHSHVEHEDHQHRHSLFLIGATHGFAGTAAIVLIVPLALSQSIATSALFLLLFGIGTIGSMTVLAFALGTVAKKLDPRTIPLVQNVAGIVSVCVGLLWIGQSVRSL